MTEPDVIDEMRELMRRHGIEPVVCAAIARVLRRNWKGRVYIRGKDIAIDDTIRQALGRGEKPDAIAKRVGVHRTTIIRRSGKW